MKRITSVSYTHLDVYKRQVIRNGNMIVDKQAKEFERDKLVYYMTGQEIEVTPFQYRKISDKPVLELENCSQHGSFYDCLLYTSFRQRRGFGIVIL